MKRQKIVQLLILLLSIIFILAAILYSYVYSESGNSNVNTILLSIGCSILAVVIINFVEYQIILPEVNTLKIMNLWKLVSIFETRQEMNNETNKLLKNALELDIAAFGSKGLLNFQGEILKERLTKGLKIRFLVPNKDSAFIRQREVDENATTDEIKNNIARLIAWVESTKKELNLGDGKILIKEYSSLPTESIMRIDNDVFVGPFMINKVSQLTMAYQYKKNGKGYEYYHGYFNRIWDNDEITRFVGGDEK
ncbi:hypothetical protein [Aeromonas piscicola]|uniref:hypothetical protein n=1 Tax=Aeromonas piscicola TaxID=600645 RepID=UPI0021F89066|nr:hypothetical protein [Aeromonas piscicola]MCW0507852.1 hypothetical protein [Aeromonas piscicola]